MADLCNEFERRSVALDEIEGIISVQQEMISAVEAETINQGFVSHYEYGRALSEDEQHDQNAFDMRFAQNMEEALSTQSFDEFMDDYTSNIALARETGLDIEVLKIECSVSMIGDINSMLQGAVEDIESVTNDLGNSLAR
ncbi:hypothetical protein N0B44_12190 [Roseibacterium beibuensis]|uniref:Uncharacterized protein n=1 Tax=[Roseibacterium] beibuensis TaxID=1193142 RepID=A0ABP9L7E0_9RHOB|nr:hypothetical protein [Roseibacterium beibuensis]MCS6623673.1 hypothetical protein [Roseibacterium beibuensis]